jgi:hypothetical protein
MPATHIPTVRDCWSRIVPVLALDYEPLFNSLLALAALHMITLGVDDAELSACRSIWLEGALRRHREGLDQLSTSNADAACFTSSLLHIDSFGSLKDRALDRYEPPVHWLRILRGTRAVIQASRPLLDVEPKPAFATIIRSYDDYLTREAMADPEASPIEYPQLLEDYGLDDMRDPETVKAYRHAVWYVGLIKHAVEAGEPLMALYRGIIAFPSLVPLRFLDLVEEMAPRALIVMAHIFAFGAQCQEIWTIGSIPRREVQGMYTRIPSNLRHLMDWPMSIVSPKDGETDSKISASDSF